MLSKRTLFELELYARKLIIISAAFCLFFAMAGQSAEILEDHVSSLSFQLLLWCVSAQLGVLVVITFGILDSQWKKLRRQHFSDPSK